jgi:hypothetical protein
MKTDTKPTKISPMPAMRPSAIVGAIRTCARRNVLQKWESASVGETDQAV